MLKKSLLFATLAACLAGMPACSQREPAAPAVAVPIPASSPLAKVQVGMTEIDVRKAIGEPTTSRSYMTGKAWMPFYYGGDTSRAAWVYAGQGEVVFSRNRYTGGLKVIRVDYKPDVR
jgi:outer membrane protein assembly factor BamE (lipoprotein component of BamABCDE complex)